MAEIIHLAEGKAVAILRTILKRFHDDVEKYDILDYFDLLNDMHAAAMRDGIISEKDMLHWDAERQDELDRHAREVERRARKPLRFGYD